MHYFFSVQTTVVGLFYHNMHSYYKEISPVKTRWEVKHYSNFSRQFWLHLTQYFLHKMSIKTNSSNRKWKKRKNAVYFLCRSIEGLFPEPQNSWCLGPGLYLFSHLSLISPLNHHWLIHPAISSAYLPPTPSPVIVSSLDLSVPLVLQCFLFQTGHNSDKRTSSFYFME